MEACAIIWNASSSTEDAGMPHKSKMTFSYERHGRGEEGEEREHNIPQTKALLKLFLLFF